MHKRVLLVVTLSFGCAKPVPPPSAEAPTPREAPITGTAEVSDTAPSFVSSEERAEVREYMWALANEVRALDEELEFGKTSDGDRYAIEAELERILAITDDLQRANQAIRHPMLSASLPRFREQVEFALIQARDESPTYVTAGKLIGSCSTCHDVRACPFDSYSRCIEEKDPSGD